MQKITILIHCKDQKGIIAAVTTFIAKVEGNITYIDQHVDVEQNVFFMRLECELTNHNITIENLKTDFDFIITAQQARAYKPSLKVFNVALDKIKSPKEKILHIAQSFYHDIIPAKELGVRTVLVKRRGFGATPRVISTDTNKPDFEVENLKDILDILT